MLGVLQAVLPGAAFAQTWPRLISLWPFDETSGTSFADSGPADVPMALVGSWADLSTGSLIEGVDGTSAYTNGSAYATIPANRPDHDLAALTISFYYQRIRRARSNSPGGWRWHPGRRLLDRGAGERQAARLPRRPGRCAAFLRERERHHRHQSAGRHRPPDRSQPRSVGGEDLSGWRRRCWTPIILANRNGWNNSRVKYLGIFTDGVSGPANGAFDGLRIWNQPADQHPDRHARAARSIALPGALPLVPAMDFLASDGTLPGSDLVYVYTRTSATAQGRARPMPRRSRPRSTRRRRGRRWWRLRRPLAARASITGRAG